MQPCWKILLLLLHIILITEAQSDESWWAYKDELEGNFVPVPWFWGLVNSEWKLCSVGKKQSPVNIETRRLTFDPFLTPLHIKGGGKIRGVLYNTGRHVTVRVGGAEQVCISGGPLSYEYKLYEIRLHFGRDHTHGSEHLINGKGFPGEVQLIHYNQDLYLNYSDAEKNPHGLAIISLFMKISEPTNPFLLQLLSREIITRISYKHEVYELRELKLEELYPDTLHYVTYEGSLTVPPCLETVTWILINKPVYISELELQSLRLLSQNEASQIFLSLSDNQRPLQNLNQRCIHTNINIHTQHTHTAHTHQCVHTGALRTHYRVNEWLLK